MTGAEGFIGRYLVKKLMDEGNDVFGLSRGKTSSSTLTCDLTRKEDLQSIPHDIDYVIHLAAKIVADPLSILNNNIIGTMNLLEYMHTVGISKIVYFSSWSVYGFNPSAIPMHEELAPHPSDTYAISKQVGELLCKVYEKEYGFKVTILRPSYVYGRGMHSNTALARFIEKAKKNEDIILFNNGEDILDFVHVADVVDATLKSIQGPPGTFNIATGMPVKIGEVARLIVDTTKSRSRFTVQEGKARRLVCSIEKAKKELGYIVKYPPEVGIPSFAREEGKKAKIEINSNLDEG